MEKNKVDMIDDGLWDHCGINTYKNPKMKKKIQVIALILQLLLDKIKRKRKSIWDL